MRNRHALARMAVVIGVSLNAPDVRAHHSFAPHFDASKPVSISGTLTEYEGRNPHSYVHIAAVDENGKTREYVCESHGVTQLTRNGITPQLFKAGTKVRVTGSLSRHSPYMCFFDTIELADGRTLSVNGPRGPARPATTVATQARKDIFGVWLQAPIPGRSRTPPATGPRPARARATGRAAYAPARRRRACRPRTDAAAARRTRGRTAPLR